MSVKKRIETFRGGRGLNRRLLHVNATVHRPVRRRVKIRLKPVRSSRRVGSIASLSETVSAHGRRTKTIFIKRALFSLTNALVGTGLATAPAAMPRSLRQLFSSCAIVFLFIFFFSYHLLFARSHWRAANGRIPRRNRNAAADGKRFGVSFPGNDIVPCNCHRRPRHMRTTTRSIFSEPQHVLSRNGGIILRGSLNDLKNHAKKCFCLRNCHYSKTPQWNIYFIKNVWKKRRLLTKFSYL